MNFITWVQQLLSGQQPQQDSLEQKVSKLPYDHVARKMFDEQRSQNDQLTKNMDMARQTGAQPQPMMPAPRNVSSMDEFQQAADPLFEKYKFPKAIGMGQFAAEGRLSGMGAGRNNFYNLNAVDANPDQANTFETPEAGVEAYLRYVTGQATDSFYPNGPESKQGYADAYNKFLQTGDVEQYLLDIQNLGYAGDPATYPDRAKNSYPSYRSFVMDTPEFKNNMSK